MTFQKAERKKAKLRLALMGPSGSGKTYSALLIAQGIGGKIAMIDTERGSGELYADLCDYDVAPITPPFTPQKYNQLIIDAEKAGYDVLIIDSLSHAWAGEGGMLDMHDKATKASRSGNSYTAWAEVTPHHTKLVNTILQSGMHVIFTLRTKTAYELQEDGKGKKKPVKIGLAPVFRDGIEYESTLALDIAIDGHIATASKDRTSMFDGQYFVPSVETGKQLIEWLESGKETVKIEPQADKPNDGGNGKKTKTFADTMATVKLLVGKEAYYDCLGVHGYEHASEITDRAIQTAIYTELRDFAKQKQPSSPQAG
jgi:hypothetical protein